MPNIIAATSPYSTTSLTIKVVKKFKFITSELSITSIIRFGSSMTRSVKIIAYAPSTSPSPGSPDPIDYKVT